MIGWRTHSMAMRLAGFSIAMGVCALFAPWWGTPIVVAVSYFVFQLPTRSLCTIAFVSWVVASVYRDSTNAFGPSRVFAKMLSIQSVGFPNDSLASRICVYALVGAIGCLLALFTGGTLKSFMALLPARLRAKKSLW